MKAEITVATFDALPRPQVKASSRQRRRYGFCSEVGRGTTIRMYMPRIDTPAEAEAATVAPALPRGST